jgi:multidrug efflux pump subunit AcrA (membrane-fusion protein)
MPNVTRNVKLWTTAGTLLALLACSIWLAPWLYARWWPGAARGGSSAAEQALRFHTVKRGQLRVLITEDGRLRAIKNNAIFPQLRGRCKITWLIPEGSSVKKGDKIATFDKKDYEDPLLAVKADLEQANRALVVAEEALKIQQSTSRASVAAAEAKLADAEIALKVYREMEGPKKLAELESAISEARTKSTAATKTLTDAQADAESGMFTQDEEQRKAQERQLAAAKAAFASAKKTLDTATLERKIQRAYTYPQQLKTRRQALDQAALDLEKARVEARSAVLQKEADLAKVKDQIVRDNTQLDNLNDQIAKCELLSPSDGMVLYGDGNTPAYYIADRIKVGMEWYGGNVLMTIPDLSNFEIDMSVPEESRGKIGPGCKATITMEAIPGLTIEGELAKVESLARGRVPWDNNSPKVFTATIKPQTCDKRMVSGMSARVELVADVLNDVLLVPIEAVVNENGDPICYVQLPTGLTQRRKVKCGKSDDHFVAIDEGLTEGEQVDLTPAHDTTAAPGAGSTPPSPAANTTPAATAKPNPT